MKYMSDIVPDEFKERCEKLANNHVNWLLDMCRPLMVEEFRHGYRHGFESALNMHSLKKKNNNNEKSGFYYQEQKIENAID